MGCGSGHQQDQANTCAPAGGNTDGPVGSGGSGVPAGGIATLAWDAPTTKTDGTPLTGQTVYRLYYGTTPGNYTAVLNVGSVTTYTVVNLASGSYYFAVTACIANGLESAYSNEVSRRI